MVERSGGTSTTRIVVPGSHSMVGLLGSSDELLRIIEKAFDADIHVRGNEITLSGDPAEIDLVGQLFGELITLLERGDTLTADSVQRSLAMLRQQTEERPADVLSLSILSGRGRTIRPKTLNQKRYVDAIDNHTIVFGIGPAGTGKTYLAMAKADHPDPSGGRGGGAARLPARHAQRQDRPLPAAALRRAARHGRS
jgi:phosphate starvation-inducible PhoH-like protein